jgi:FkbM family methyltransferase
MIDLYSLAWHMRIRPRLVMEIGVNEPDKCSLSRFIGDGVKAVLVEPLPWCADNLRKAFPSAIVIEAACGTKAGTTKLYDRGEGSWIEEVAEGNAPDEHPKHSHMKRDGFDPSFIREVRSIRFGDELDAMKPDILCVDIEGGEWMVIGQMEQSLPRIVRVETHFSHSGYCNSDRQRIFGKLLSLGYEKLMEDQSDSLFVLAQ